MPSHAIAADDVDAVLGVDDLAAALTTLASGGVLGTERAVATR